MSGRKQMNLNRVSDKMIVAGLAGLVEDDGLTPHQALEVLDDIKRHTMPVLIDIARERRQKGDTDA